ncbi:M23 family metallopeptidase [Pseudactinotalea sp. HY160]|uniref:M23 family metallopeptidase n=1 Tax=Pseudactinotalea sp. HY160 TaxID=2654490 RepID=UPI001883F4FC|nr:M23 family metallopeptidase [Pseudactinotalea sp. HY160]
MSSRRLLVGFLAAVVLLVAMPAAASNPPEGAPPDLSGPPDQPALPDPPGASGYVAPVGPVDHDPVVLRAFDPPAQPWLAGHRGVDLAAEVGSPVRAAADGTVAFAGTVAGTPVVSIDHPDGIRTTYQPVTGPLARGDPVRAGEPIGELTAGEHCGATSCLHWGARTGRDAYVDPLGLLRPPVIRLYPVE